MLLPRPKHSIVVTSVYVDADGCECTEQITVQADCIADVIEHPSETCETITTLVLKRHPRTLRVAESKRSIEHKLSKAHGEAS